MLSIIANLSPSSSSFRNGSFSLLSTSPISSTSSSSPLSYLSPSPPPSSSKPHRYLLLLFNQPNSFSINTISTTTRNNFNLKSFMNQYNLGVPLSAHFFKVGGAENLSSSSGISSSTTGEMVGKGLSNPVDDSGSSSPVKKSSVSRGSTSIGIISMSTLLSVVIYSI